jgi:hypothetical protein
MVPYSAIGSPNPTWLKLPTQAGVYQVANGAERGASSGQKEKSLGSIEHQASE